MLFELDIIGSTIFTPSYVRLTSVRRLTHIRLFFFIFFHPSYLYPSYFPFQPTGLEISAWIFSNNSTYVCFRGAWELLALHHTISELITAFSLIVESRSSRF